MEGNAQTPPRCVDSKEKCLVQTKDSGQTKNAGFIKSLLLRVAQIWPLKYMFKVLKKIVSFGHSTKVEEVGSVEQISPSGRRFVSGRKRIGRFARFILFIAPHRLQCALGYHSLESIGKDAGTEEIRHSPLKPCGKGSKRKQDDVDLEEQHSWVAFMSEDLPDEDQEDDPTYEPSNSETDSEENKSKNETESDLEVEEKDGVVMLKESPGKKQNVQFQENLVNGESTHEDDKPVCEKLNTHGEEHEQKQNHSAE